MTDITTFDWNEAWHKPEGEEGKKQGFINCGKRWDDPARCRRYSDAMKYNHWAGSQSRISAMDIRPDFRILDVGAGPGTLAIPLAKICAHVTAVEPSPGMGECLKENIREADLQNITVISKKWEDVLLHTDLTPPYDIVVASYSLGFPDLREGLLKMHEASRKYVYIFWFADMISCWQRNYLEIWERLYGVPPPSGRKPNIIYNLLHQMGIYANVEVTREEQVYRYMSIDEAVADQKDGLALTTPRQEAVLREYLQTKLQNEDGTFVSREISYRSKIWWRKEDVMVPGPIH